MVNFLTVYRGCIVNMFKLYAPCSMQWNISECLGKMQHQKYDKTVMVCLMLEGYELQSQMLWKMLMKSDIVLRSHKYETGLKHYCCDISLFSCTCYKSFCLHISIVYRGVWCMLLCRCVGPLRQLVVYVEKKREGGDRKDVYVVELINQLFHQLDNQ